MRKQSNIGGKKCKPLRPLSLNMKLKIILVFLILFSFFFMAAIKHVYTALIFTSLIAVAAVWGGVSAWINLFEAIASRDWPVVKFSFVDGHINIKFPPAGTGSHTEYTPVFKLQYEFSGETYVSSSDEIKRVKKRIFYTLNDAQEFLNQLRNGGFAYVCPQKPSILFMENGVSSKYFFVLAISVIVTVISFLVLLILVDGLYIDLFPSLVPLA